ncbi:hypothetical protein IAI10_02010 [Clostridium sp. 19966]|uniref:hypothetical protein n=1 Tax=Clostridium sp. 19966 TaxID=2768166 RepID=UPI0028E074E4|nr:hypothetical protein [Clostridium sp. 19966]MDT8715431.1 hypothetical protein [Clostridium sp. 19966]
MYNVTQNFINTIKQTGRTFKATVKIRDTTFTEADIVDLELEENVNPDESFMIGGVGSSKLELTLMNVPGTLILDGAPVTAALSLLVNGAYENVPLGTFMIDEISKDKANTKLTCYDNMIRLEQAYFSDLSYPAGINSVAQEICNKAGVMLSTALPSTSIAKIEGYTYREAISFIASFLGGFARFNRDGKLEITTYTESNFSIDKTGYFPPLTLAEKNFTIGKLTCKAGDSTLTAGTNGNEIQFENPVMTQAQLNSIYNTLKNLSYMPYSMNWLGNPALQAGDKITITDTNNNVYSTLLMDNKISYKGGLSGSASASGKTDTGQNFSSSGSIKNSVDRMVIEQANIKTLLADKATIEDLTATNGRIDNLSSTYATIVNLNATNARIDNLSSTYATIDTLQANYALIKDLTAATGRITNLESNAASINNLLAGNLTAQNMQANFITAGSGLIANGAIADAQIANLSVSKILAGDISTTKFRLVSDSGNMLMSDNTLQIKDASRVRVQIGKDASNDYTIYVWDSSGNLMFDATGLKANGIKDKIIRDDMVSDTANIQGTKLNIASVFTAMNGSSSVLKATKVQLDDQGQTLQVAFTNLQTTVTNTANTVSSQGTSISTIQGQISQKVWQQDITTAINNIDLSVRNLYINSLFSNWTPIGNIAASKDYTDGYDTNCKAFRLYTHPAGVQNINAVDETNGGITYSGTWSSESSSLFYGGTEKYTRTQGSYLTFKFRGTGIRLFCATSQNRGIAKITIDGTVYNADMYSSALIYKAKVFETTSLDSGLHTIKIEVSNTKNVNATDYYILVDYFEIIGGTIDQDTYTIRYKNLIKENGNYSIGFYAKSNNASYSVAYDEKAAVYSGNWIADTSSNLYGGSCFYSSNVGDSATFKFKGTGIALVTCTYPDRGIANVYVDGILDTTVDNYSSTQQWNKVIYTKTGLTFGEHTIKIEVTNTKNPSATGYKILIDYFQVIYTPPYSISIDLCDKPSTQISVTNTWTYYKIENITIDNYSSVYNFIDFTLPQDSDILISHFMVVENKNIIPWEQAPEDVQTQINTVATSITQTATAIGFDLTSQTLTQTGLNQRLTSAESFISINKDKIQSSVSQSAIDASISNLQIGGRNLLINSGFKKNASNWVVNSTVILDTANTLDGCNSLLSNQVGLTANSWRGAAYASNAISCKQGDIFTASIYVKSDNISGIDYDARYEIDFYDTNGSRISLPFISVTPVANNTWQKFIMTATAPANAVYVNVFFYVTRNGKVWFAKPKLESGSKATDYTPAPEDVQTQIDSANSSITQTANSIATKVDKNGVISAINQTAESIQISASKINLSGYATFTSLSTPGQTTINGANITTGTITSPSGKIKLNLNNDEMDISGTFKWLGSSSYTTMSGDELVRVDNDGSHTYHFLIETGTEKMVQHDSGGTTVTVQLPAAFKGKNFKVITSISGIDFGDVGGTSVVNQYTAITTFRAFVDSYSYANATFDIFTDLMLNNSSATSFYFNVSWIAIA